MTPLSKDRTINMPKNIITPVNIRAPVIPTGLNQEELGGVIKNCAKTIDISVEMSIAILICFNSNFTDNRPAKSTNKISGINK